jgi:hypothetical protein
MENANKGNRQKQGNQNSGRGSEGQTGSPNQWNDQNQVVNEQDQNRAVNTGDPEFKENVTGRTQEQPPRDLNLSGSYDKNASENSEGGAEIETPHKHEGDDEESTERKIPKM